jgi:DHA1 family inner membrane transport protein
MLSRAQFPWVALIVIAATIFVSVTSEFLPTGLLPDIASELQVSESRVGFLVTLFAGTVVVTAAPLSILTRRFSRKSVVIVVMVLFLLANVAAGIAPTYELLAAARVLGGLAHGLFWAVMGAYAAHLVPKKQLGRAVAITSSGATAAFVLGVPLGTALGHAVGWRLAFVSIAGIILVLIALVVRYLPAVDRHIEPPLRTGEIRLPARHDPSVPLIVMVCVVIFVVITGHNAFFTYVAPWLTTVAAIPPDGIPGVLFLYGGAGAIGLVVAGIVTDRFPRLGLIVAVALIAVVVSALALVSGSTPLAIVAVGAWGAAFGGVPSMIQTRMLHGVSPRLRDLSSALITTSFNVGIGGGALVGGLLLDHVGIRTLPWFDVALTVVGLVVLIVGTVALARRRTPASY